MIAHIMADGTPSREGLKSELSGNSMLSIKLEEEVRRELPYQQTIRIFLQRKALNAEREKLGMIASGFFFSRCYR